MNATKIQYTVDPSFAETNAANIREVMNALKANPIDGLSYAAYQLADGQTFMHLLLYADDEAKSKIPELAEFKHFQAALKQSKPVSPPVVETIELVGASFQL